MTRFESLISNTDIVVPERMLTMFDLFNEDIVSHVTQMNTFEDPTYPQSYSVRINKQQMIVHCSFTRPVQFSLGSLSSLAAFTDKRGVGWNNKNIKRYFNLPDTIDKNRNDESTKEGVNDNKKNKKRKRDPQVVNTARKYEEIHVLLLMVRHIKISKKKDVDKMEFHVKCEMKHYQPTNKTIRARHPTLFKNDTYCFQPIDELVLSMPYNSIANLKPDIWTNVDKDWMRSLHQHMLKADNNVIKQI